MRNNFIQRYYDFFDKQIGDSTLVVGLIGVMIFLAGFLSDHDKNLMSYKSNILEYNDISTGFDANTIYISGKKYKVLFQEVK